MKKLSLLLVALFFVSICFSKVITTEKQLWSKPADTTSFWKKGGVVSLGTSQTSLTNWAAGGLNSFAVNGLVSLFANYKNGKSSFDNTLDIGYGMLKQGKDAKFRKTDDKIDFMSKYGREAGKSWYYTGLVNFKTQCAPGYNYPNDSIRISDFMAPAYLTVALGMDYKPSAVFTLFLAPLTSRVTFVNNKLLSDAGAFGVDKGKKSKTEIGGYLRAAVNKTIMTNVNLQTKLDLFSNYAKNPGNIDVNWETLISMKVNKYISATLTTQLIYDDDVDIAIDKNNDGVIEENGPRIQFKEVLGVGLSFNF